MAYRSIYTFSHEQEVEVTFDLEGYRGGWFHCRIHKIRNGNSGEEVRISFVDFPDTPKEWVTVCDGNPRTFMVRPLPPLIHEDDVQQYTVNNVPLGGSVEVFCYDYNYEEEEAVEMRLDDIFWTGTIARVNNRTDQVRISFPNYPDDETLVPKNSKDLRPAMLWDQDSESPWTHRCTDIQPQAGLETSFQMVGDCWHKIVNQWAHAGL